MPQMAAIREQCRALVRTITLSMAAMASMLAAQRKLETQHFFMVAKALMLAPHNRWGIFSLNSPPNPMSLPYTLIDKASLHLEEKL